MKTTICALLLGLFLASTLTGPVLGQAALTKIVELAGYENVSQNAGLIEGPDGTLFGWIGHAGQERRSRLWRINRDGSNLTVLHTFAGLSGDGEDPTGLTFGSDGTLYGVARDQQGLGRIFAVSPNGTDYRVIKQFDAVSDRTANPFGLIEASDHRLYGVTGTGGPNGVVFGINRDGSGYQELHRFGVTRTDGQFPRGELLEGPDRVLYGVTASDRTSFFGTVYRVGRDGSDYRIIHQFTGGGQGIYPESGLVMGMDGFLYGQTSGGGVNNVGGVFKLQRDGTGYQFYPTGTGNSQWYRSVSESSNGFLYGLLPGGGPEFRGSFFRLHPDGSGFETLHQFSEAANPTEGSQPKQLLHARDGYFYFLTHQRSPTPIGSLTAYTPYLMRYGPVPLPSTTPNLFSATASLVPNGPASEFRLSFVGRAGSAYEIQFSDTLPAQWIRGQVITADPQGRVEYTETPGDSPGSRFYRVVGE